MGLLTNSVNALLKQGASAARDGNWAKAEELFLSALALDPLDFSAHFGLAVVLERTGRRDKALKHYRRATRLNPGNSLLSEKLRRFEATLGPEPTSVRAEAVSLLPAPKQAIPFHPTSGRNRQGSDKQDGPTTPVSLEGKAQPRPTPNKNQEEIAGWRMAPEPELPEKLTGLEGVFEYLPRIAHVLRPYSRFILISVATVLLTVLAGLLTPWPFTILIDNVLGNQPPVPAIAPLIAPFTNNRVVLLVLIVVAEVVIKLAGNVLSVVQTYVDSKVELQVDFDFRSELFQHAQRLSLPFYDATSSGGMAVGMTYESNAAGTMVMDLIPIGQSVLSLIGMLWISFQLDWQLTLLSLLVIPFLYYSVGYYATHIQARLVEVRGMAGQSILVVNETLRMLRVIIAFGREEHEYGRFRSLGETLNDLNTKVAVREAFLSIAVNITTAIGTTLVLGLGAYHVLSKQLTTGELLVILSYIAAVYAPLETISTTIGELQNLYLSLRLGFHILDTEPEIRDAPAAVSLARVEGEVAFEHVSFNYPGREGTLKDISFGAHPGQVIALVGPTGAGKTTLMSLLPRFYDASQGRVLLDGLDLKQIQLGSLRNQISIVLQEPLLFSGSIQENIRYGRLDASFEEIVEAARAANADEFICNLPEGYDTVVGERGARLSGGERQRISVARAFLRDAPILILDEPTSSIDSKTESVILDALDRLMVGRTTFITAHRLSTIRHADLILVLNRGELVEQGTHEELVARGGLYHQLYTMQTQARVRRSHNGHNGNEHNGLQAPEGSPLIVRSAASSTVTRN